MLLNLFENLREQSSNLWLFHVKNGKKQNFRNLFVVLYKRFVQILNHIAGEHAKCAKFFTCDAACFLVQTCAEYGCFGSCQTLCEECDDDSRKYISAAALCHAGIRDRNDINVAIRSCNVCWCAF